MKSNELRTKYLQFFEEKGHVILPSASLVPENDPTVLFTTAGMHPLVPFLMGEKHPGGKRIANVQKCVRTGDIDEVGDNRHATFFEMLGNWSLGDYFKTESITWSFEFLTHEKWLAIDPDKIYVSCFAGDDDAPRDKDSIEGWQKQFKSVGREAEVSEADHNIDGGQRIFLYGKGENWWGPAGCVGPCGPDTEIFYDTGMAHNTDFGEHCHPNCDCGRFIEIWNNVFMEYNKTPDGKYIPLEHKNIDTGMGLDRTIAVLNGFSDIYEIDLFKPLIELIEEMSGKKYVENTTSFRVIADHVRTATMMLGDPLQLAPSNLDQGYILRRLIRRAVRHAKILEIEPVELVSIAKKVVELFGETYTELNNHEAKIVEELEKEIKNFEKTLERGLREFEKRYTKSQKITGEDAFILFSTYGFPLELTEELVTDRGGEVDDEAFKAEFEKHKKLSRAGAEKKFKGGLADESEMSRKYHTATHLLHTALRQVLGDHVEQRGSNINAERLRFDFSHPEKLTDEQKTEVEQIVNQAIKANYPVECLEVSLAEAKEMGAVGLFGDKYGDVVKVYKVGDVSSEICGGPHVSYTGDLGKFKIKKEKASSAGVRRIKAVLE